MTEDPLIWDVRAFVYAHFVDTTRAPQVGDIAAHFNIAPEIAANALRSLHDRHALFLEPATTQIRIANPFSAIPTDYKVHARGKTYTANCAWDSFGIVAALHEQDAEIHARCTHSGEPIDLRVANGAVMASSAVVHFLVPFQRWYDDLVHT